nr:MAG TPA: Protein of unknown function (DUF2856) [Caudoviricetes sp.]
MTVLSEMPTGIGSKFILAKYSDTFYGYGTEMDHKSAWGLPVNQCGTKEEVLENCLRMIEVNNMREILDERLSAKKHDLEQMQDFLKIDI